MKKQVTFDSDIKHYHGPKMPSMPAGESIRSVCPLKVLAEQSVIRRRAQDLDFEFLKSIVCVPQTPDYGNACVPQTPKTPIWKVKKDFNTKLAREQS